MKSALISSSRCVLRGFARRSSRGAAARASIVCHSVLQTGDENSSSTSDLALRDVRVVLVAPKTPSNVGAAARCAANFDVSASCIIIIHCMLMWLAALTVQPVPGLHSAQCCTLWPRDATPKGRMHRGLPRGMLLWCSARRLLWKRLQKHWRT